MIGQCLPQLSVNERYYAARIFWCAAVILAVFVISLSYLEEFPMSHSFFVGGRPTSPASRHFYQHSAHSTQGFHIVRLHTCQKRRT